MKKHCFFCYLQVLSVPVQIFMLGLAILFISCWTFSQIWTFHSNSELNLSYISLGHKSNFAGHVIVTTGLRRMHFPRPGYFLRWNSNLQQVDFSQGFALKNILGLVVLAVNMMVSLTYIHVWSVHFAVYIFAIWKFKYSNHTFLRYPS